MHNSKVSKCTAGQSTVKSSARLMQRLRCPVCREALIDRADTFQCTATCCGSIFPIIDGIPILIDQDRSIFRCANFASGRTQSSIKSRLKNAVFRFLPGLDLNLAGRSNIALVEELLQRSGGIATVLNIGGKHPSSATAKLAASDRIECIECDLVIRDRTSVVADPAALPIEDVSVDAVLIDAMLEHVIDPEAVVAEAHRVLKPGGLIYVDTPFMLQVHGGALDFTRYTPLGHRRLLRRFEEIASGITAGPGVALGYSIQYFFLSFARSDYMRVCISALCRLLFFWLKYFDYFLASRPGALDAAQGVYFLGRKVEEELSDRRLIAGYAGSTKSFYPLGTDLIESQPRSRVASDGRLCRRLRIGKRFAGLQFRDSPGNDG